MAPSRSHASPEKPDALFGGQAIGNGGDRRLDDFRREYPNLPDVESVETMGGLLTHLLGVVPDAKEYATFAGLRLTAQITDGRRVNELLVQKIK